MEGYDYGEAQEKWERYLEAMKDEMYETIRSFGPAASIDFLMGLPKDVHLFNTLLALYPFMASTAGFISKLPVFEMNENEVKNRSQGNKEG